ncbi:MAG: oligosaccharide flippase family protein [Caldicoprobacterales bacterium]
MKKKAQLLKNKIARNILVITGGAAIAQVLNMFFSPIITRLYSPEEYGVMAVLTSLLMVLSFQSLRYEMAIPIAEDDDKAVNVAGLCLFILCIFSFILTLSLAVKGDVILKLLDADELIKYKYFVSLGVFMVGLYNIQIQWMYRRKNFNLISKTRVGQNLIGNLTKIGAGYLGFGAWGLLLGKIMSESISVISFTKYFVKNELALVKKIKRKDLTWSLKRYKNFPMYQTPSTFLATLKNQLPVFSLTMYGNEVVGLYGLANTVVKLPMTLVGHSVRNVFFAEAASIGKSKPKELKKLSDKLLKKMIVLGLIPLIVLIALGPFLFSLVFGSEWLESGVLARYLAVAIYADFVFSPVSRVYEVLERQKEKMFLDLGGLALVFLSFLTARLLSAEPRFAIILYSLSMTLYYLTTYILSNKYLKDEIRKQFE